MQIYFCFLCIFTFDFCYILLLTFVVAETISRALVISGHGCAISELPIIKI